MGQVPYFFHYRFNRSAAKGAAHTGNHTIGAAVAAAFGHFNISAIRRHRRNTGCFFVIKSCQAVNKQGPASLQSCSHRLLDSPPGSGSQNNIHFRHFIQKFLLIPLPQTTGHNKTAAASCFLKFRHLQNCLQRFFFSGVNKAAGIDN